MTGRLATPDPSLFPPHPNDQRKDPTMTVKDPVCGMSVDPATAVATSEHDGMTFHLCSSACKQRLDQDPAAYVTAST